MDKQIITEISRLHELMGISKDKSLLLEANIAKKFSGWLERVLKGLDNTIKKRGRRIGGIDYYRFELPNLNKIISATKKELEDIGDYLVKGTKKWDELTSNSKILLKSLLQEGGHLDTDKLYNDYINELIGGGSNEEKLIKNILQELNRTDKTTGKKYKLQDVLKNILGDDEEIFIDTIIPKVNKQINEYEDGALELVNGRLVPKRGQFDIEDFYNLVKFSKDEINALSNPGFVKGLKQEFDILKTNAEELKKLFINYQDSKISIKDEKQLEKLITTKMNQLFNNKKDTYEYMKSFIDKLGKSEDQKLIKLSEKLKELETKNGGWDVIKKVASETPKLQQYWISTTEALKSATSGIRYTLGFKWIPDLFRVMGSAFRNADIPNKVAKESDGEIWNTLKVNSPRGYPWPQKLGEDGTKTVNYYKKLTDMGGLPLARISYFTEYAFRLVLYQTITNLIKALLDWIRFSGGTDDKMATKVIPKLLAQMRQRKIYTSNELLGPYKAEAKWMKDTGIYEIKDPQTVSTVFSICDYLASPTSELGKYFWGNLAEKMKTNPVASTLLALQPSRGVEFAYDLWNYFNQKVSEKDLAGIMLENPKLGENAGWEEKEESFKLWCEGFEKKYEKWDDKNKIGYADGKKWKLKNGNFVEDNSNNIEQNVTNTIDEFTTEKQLFLDQLNKDGWRDADGTSLLPNWVKDFFTKEGDVWTYTFCYPDENNCNNTVKYKYDPNSKTFTWLSNSLKQ